MPDRELRRALQRTHPPDEIGAERRAWALALAAYEQREPAPRRPAFVRPLVAVALALAVIGAIVNPPVLNAIRDSIGRTKEKKVVYKRALFSLPAPGRLLVNSARGPWIIRPRGQRRLLGHYRDASWSPRGLFVTALGPHEVVALQPNGAVRWSLARSGRLSSPRWSPEIAGSTRIAYLRGRSLRVVAGDSKGDHLVDASVRRVAPAWRPATFALAYVDAGGHARLVDPDTGRTIWRVPAAKAVQLSWSDDGSRLLVLTDRAVLVYRGADGNRVGVARLPSRAVAADFQPGSHRIALLLRGPQRSTVQIRDADAPGSKPRTVFSADGRFETLAWSPNGRWLLAGWQSADAFIFMTPSGRQHIVADIARQLGSFPAVPRAGWCCGSSR